LCPRGLPRGHFCVRGTRGQERTPMLRVLIVLFWVSLLVGTLVAHSVVANWAVTLAALYFTARWWAGRRRDARSSAAARMAAPAAPAQPETAANTPATGPVRSRWTVDRVHSAERPWR